MNGRGKGTPTTTPEKRRSEVVVNSSGEEEPEKPEQINNYFRIGETRRKIDTKDEILTHLKPINCSAGGAVLAGCAAFVVVASHHSGKADRKLEKLSVIKGGEGKRRFSISRTL